MGPQSMLRNLLIVVVLATSCFAQSALVVPIGSFDVAKIKQVHQQMEDAEKAWADLQKDISQRYLIVDKSDPDASDDRWYPPEKTSSGLFTTSYVSSGSFMIANGGGDLSTEDTCDPKRVAEHKAWEAEQKQREQEREAKSRRWRKGWYPHHNCEGCDPLAFEFSADFRYIVPVKPVPEPANPFNWIQPTGTVLTPSTLASQ